MPYPPLGGEGGSHCTILSCACQAFSEKIFRYSKILEKKFDFDCSMWNTFDDDK